MSDYITTDELVKEAEKLGLRAIVEYKTVEVFNAISDYRVARVLCGEELKIDTMYSGWSLLKHDVKQKLYGLLDRYARTPLDKRQEQKKYRLRLDISDEVRVLDGSYRYLAKSREYENYYCLSLPNPNDKFQDVFTQAEIDEMGDLTRGFIKEEVCEN